MLLEFYCAGSSISELHFCQVDAHLSTCLHFSIDNKAFKVNTNNETRRKKHKYLTWIEFGCEKDCSESVLRLGFRFTPWTYYDIRLITIHLM